MPIDQNEEITMNNYFEANQKYLLLKEKYDKKLAELDPLKWRMEEAKRQSDAAWVLARNEAMIATKQSA